MALHPNQMSFQGHAKAIASLGIPLIGGHLAQFAIGITDTIMLGWYGVGELAAVTLASSYFFVCFILGSGFAFAVMPIVASANAQNDHQRIRRSTRMGLWLSVVFAISIMPFLWFAGDVLLLLGQEPSVAKQAGDYLQIAGWGIFPALLVMVLRSYLGGLERAQIVLWVTVLAAVVNAAANAVFIFGAFGLPAFGITGAALASLLTQIVSFTVIIAYALKQLPEHDLLRNLHKPDWIMMREIWRHGFPIGLTAVSEVTLFSASGIMMGWLGTNVLAAHGIAVSLSGLVFMLHLGLSNVATIRVSNALGRIDPIHLKRGAVVISIISFSIACVTIFFFLITRESLVGLYLATDDPQRNEIIAIGATLVAISGLFQLVDAMQAVALGLLRGLLDTKIPMCLAALSYWAFGIPTGYILSITMGLGGIGVWIGLVIGLAAAGVLLMSRFWFYSLPRVFKEIANNVN